MNVAIVVAAGRGTRFGGNRPKQFVELNGIPIIIHTLRQFERSQEIDSVVMVLPAAQTAGFQSLAEEFGVRKVRCVVAGGETRARSVRNGLPAVDDADLVAVHDGVRPLVTPEEIDRVVQAAHHSRAATLVAPITDTIKEVTEAQVVRTVPRAGLWRALTPQCFGLEVLHRAYQDLDELESLRIEITDDSFLVERLGIQVSIVEGSARNIKITSEEDLALAQAVLGSI